MRRRSRRWRGSVEEVGGTEGGGRRRKRKKAEEGGGAGEGKRRWGKEKGKEEKEEEEEEEGVREERELTWAMTSRDQLSPMLIGWLLIMASEGLSSVGPKTVAKLCSDILLTFSFSATLRTPGRGQLIFDL